MLSAEGYGVLPITEVSPEQLAGFDCGKSHLNEFLMDKARDMHERRIGFSTVIFHQDVEGPVGYFTLANDSIPLSDSEKFDFDLTEAGLSSFPAVKLGRLAVRSGLQSNGIGDHAMSVLILGVIVGSEAFSAARLIVLDADNEPRVIKFYEKLGFERSLWAERNASKAAHLPRRTVKMHRDILKA